MTVATNAKVDGKAAAEVTIDVKYQTGDKRLGLSRRILKTKPGDQVVAIFFKGFCNG